MKFKIDFLSSSFFALLGLGLTSVSTPALTINSTNNGNDLVNNILGSGITVDTNSINYVGTNNSSGFFSNGDVIGINSGIILTTGNANDAVGPNSEDNTGTSNDLPGDADLDNLLSDPDSSTFDATILEFEFESKKEDLFFEYVFASEEYNEFVEEDFNDIFGFFLDGKNIALIPGTQIPVSIDNVNGGNPFGTNASNPNLYNNNDSNDPGPSIFDIEYDGFTNVFTAEALGLTPGKHTVKLVIADAGDSDFDSAVFIKEGSFGPEPTVVPESSSLFALITCVTLTAGLTIRGRKSKCCHRI